ncbi:C6 transcription factor, partial [Pyrenophora tritici-repentis]
ESDRIELIVAESTIDIGKVFATQAEKILQQCYRAYPGVVVVETLLILGWRELTLDNDNMAWMYNCMCSGLTTHLGLHAVTLQDNASTPSKRQSSRIIAFWRSFWFDRIATFSLGRHCVIPVKRIRTRFPKSTYPSSMSLSQLVFDHECRFLMIFDTFMEQIYSFDFYEMEEGKRRQLLLDARDEILRLYQGMDILIARPIRSSSSSILTLHMLHHMGLLLVQRPFLREDTTSGLYRMAIRSMYESAVSINNLSRNYRTTTGFAKATVVHMQCILTAALMHLLGVTSSDKTVERRSITRFRFCVESLKEMKSMRSRSARAISLLQELANRWKVVRALPLELSYPLGQAFKDGSAQQGQSRAAQIDVLRNDDSTDGLGIHDATSGLGQTFHAFDGFPFDLWPLDNLQGVTDVGADILDPADPFRDASFP